MQSPYKSNGSKRTKNTPSDLNRPQMTSKEPVITDSTNQTQTIKPITNKRNKLNGGSLYEADEINDESLDKNCHKNTNL